MAGVRRTPVFKNAFELAFGDMWQRQILRHISDAEIRRARPLSICPVLLKTSWPSTRTFSSRAPFSNSHAYNPPCVSRRRLMQLWPIRSCGFSAQDAF